MLDHGIFGRYKVEKDKIEELEDLLGAVGYNELERLSERMKTMWLDYCRNVLKEISEGLELDSLFSIEPENTVPKQLGKQIGRFKSRIDRFKVVCKQL